MSEPSEPEMPEDLRAPELPSEEASPSPLFAKVREKAHAPVPERVAMTEPETEFLSANIFCRECGRYAEQGGYAVLLCGECRRAFAFRPFPLRVLAALAALALIVGIALIRLPGVAGAGVAFERGERAERGGDFPAAAVQYRIVVRRFPDATLALVRLAVASAHTGNVRETLAVFDKLSGRTLSNDLIAELNGAEAKLRKSLEVR